MAVYSVWKFQQRSLVGTYAYYKYVFQYLVIISNYSFPENNEPKLAHQRWDVYHQHNIDIVPNLKKLNSYNTVIFFYIYVPPIIPWFKQM